MFVQTRDPASSLSVSRRPIEASGAGVPSDPGPPVGLLPLDGFLESTARETTVMIVNYLDSYGITIFALRQVGHCCFVPFLAPPSYTGAGLPLHNIEGPLMLPGRARDKAKA